MESSCVSWCEHVLLSVLVPVDSLHVVRPVLAPVLVLGQTTHIISLGLDHEGTHTKSTS